MGQKSLIVPQPVFSEWVIKRRQELNLSPACLQEKLAGKLSERTLKYLGGGKKDTFSEYTLTCLAQGLEMDYPELLSAIDGLRQPVTQNRVVAKKASANKLRLLAIPAVFACLLLFVFINGNLRSIFSKENQDGEHCLQDVLVHSDYPQIVVAVDGKGNTLWQKNLETRISRVRMADLDRDGQVEIIAGTIKSGSGEKGKSPGLLTVWNERGELLTEHNVWRPSIYPCQEPLANVEDFAITDLENDGVPEIVVIVCGYEYYPSRLAVFHYRDATLQEVKTFWNPGYLTGLYVEDVDGDGLPDIVCKGANNDFKRLPSFGVAHNAAAIMLLKGTAIYGQAPPYLGKAQHGSQVWYKYTTTTAENHKLASIAGVQFAGEKRKEIRVMLEDSCYFYLDAEGNIIDRFLGDHCTGASRLHSVSNEKTW